MSEQKTIFIDVREPAEYNSGHVPGAINIPPSALLQGAQELKGVPKDTRLVPYCVTGSRSNASIHILQKMGFTNLVNGVNKQQVMQKYDSYTHSR